MPDALPALRSRGFALPRAGNAADEYEDALAADAEAGRFAVADGASESCFAGTWARLLADGFVGHPGPWPGWLRKARRRWKTEHQSDSLPWYVQERFEEGAFATLLGVAIASPGRGGRRTWEALCVGDCCLFQVRDGRLIRAFPLQRSEEFTNRPTLLASRRPASRTRRVHARGVWRPGDLLLLMTDALARWFLVGVEAGRRPWEAIAQLEIEADFAVWVEAGRKAGGLHNDDATLLVIETLPQEART